MSAGVYAITNLESGKIYTGSTVDLMARWCTHVCDLRHKRHKNPHLQSAWNLYGEDAFEFTICEYVDDKEQLHIREQYWLDFHRLLTEVYNYGPCARNPMLNTRHSKEHRDKISESLMGNKRALGYSPTRETRDKIGRAHEGNEHGAKSYPAFIHKDTGEIVLGGFNLSAMCRGRGLGQASMSLVALGEALSHKGWMLLDEDARPKPCDETERRRKISEALVGVAFSEEHCRNISISTGMPYPSFIHQETGGIISAGVNLAMLCRERGLDKAAMHRVKNGEASHHKGWMLLSG